MPIYTNINGAQKLLVNLYDNINGSRKQLESMYANINGVQKQIHSKGYLWYKYTYTKTSTTDIGTVLGENFVDEIYSSAGQDDSQYVIFNVRSGSQANYKIGDNIILSKNTATLQSAKDMLFSTYSGYNQNIRISYNGYNYDYGDATECNNALKNKYVLTNGGTSISFSGNQRIGYKISKVDLLEGETGGLFPVIYSYNDSTITHNAVNVVTTYLFTCDTTIVSSTNPNQYTSSNFDWLGQNKYNTGNYVYGNSNVYYKRIE